MDNDDQRGLNLKYDDAIAFHYLKYKYDPYGSMYWRFPDNSFFHWTNENRERKRQEYEKNYQELLLVLSESMDYEQDLNN